MIQHLLDIEEIKKLKAQYFRFLDAKRWEEFGALFTPDLTADLGPLGTYGSRADFLALAHERLNDALSAHHGHTPEIELLGEDRASGTWAMFDYVDSPTATIKGYGYYEEEYRKEAGRWRISSLRLTRLRVDVLDDPA
jgi:hypothetical protein